MKRAIPYASRFFLAPFLSYYYVSRYKAKAATYRDLDDALDAAYLFKSQGLPLRIDQVREEIADLVEIVRDIEPRHVMEIGTAGGGTLFLFARASHPSARIISVDLPGGLYGLGYPLWKIPLLKAFAGPNQDIRLIRANSHSPDTLECVRTQLADDKLDFLFIDGDHTYDGVKKDFEMYSALVRKGGIIALHDILPHSSDDTVDVSRFWQEVKQKHECRELAKSRDQGWAGIGVVRV